MKFLGKSSVIFLRVFQVIMPLVTLGFFTADFPTFGFKLVWCTSLLFFEIFAWNTVRGEFTPEGLTYFRVWGAQSVTWSEIRTVRVWPATSGVIVRLQTVNFLNGYKVLINGSGLDRLIGDSVANESTAITQARNRLIGRV